MNSIESVDATRLAWESVSEGVKRRVLRNEPGEKRVVIRIEAGKGFPHHAHSVPDEVFVLDGQYVDPQVEEGRIFEAGAYLYYPAGTEHFATSPTGCTILVWNANR